MVRIGSGGEMSARTMCSVSNAAWRRRIACIGATCVNEDADLRHPPPIGQPGCLSWFQATLKHCKPFGNLATSWSSEFQT